MKVGYNQRAVFKQLNVYFVKTAKTAEIPKTVKTAEIPKTVKIAKIPKTVKTAEIPVY